jgi:hypothetical protein
VSRYVSLIDLVVLVVVGVVLFLPPREVTVGPVDRLDPDTRLALSFAEARAVLRPDDGAAVAEVARRLGDARQLDWAAHEAMVGAERLRGSPTQWRALLAASIANTDLLEVKLALEYANRTLTACAEAGDVACPSWEEVRVELYQRHLDAGVKSGIDPRKNPRAFREAGEAALRPVRAIGTNPEPSGAPR